MRKELEIIKHVIELYTGDTTDEAMANYELKNSEQVKMYAEAFRDYDLSDVLQAIDEFWNFKSSKTKPTVAQILAILNSKKEVEKDRWANVETSIGNGNDFREMLKTDAASAYMRRAWANGKTSLNRADFDHALKEIIGTKTDTLPGMSGKLWGEKIRVAYANGWLDDVDIIAERFHEEDAGRSVDVLADMEIDGGAGMLAAHWRV